MSKVYRIYNQKGIQMHSFRQLNQHPTKKMAEKCVSSSVTLCPAVDHGFEGAWHSIYFCLVFGSSSASPGQPRFQVVVYL